MIGSVLSPLTDFFVGLSIKKQRCLSQKQVKIFFPGFFAMESENFVSFANFS